MPLAHLHEQIAQPWSGALPPLDTVPAYHKLDDGTLTDDKRLAAVPDAGEIAAMANVLNG